MKVFSTSPCEWRIKRTLNGENLKKADLVFFSKSRFDDSFPFWPHRASATNDKKEIHLPCMVCENLGQGTPFRPHRIISMNNAPCMPGAAITKDFMAMHHLTNLAVHRIQNITLTSKPMLFEIAEPNFGDVRLAVA